MAKVYNSHYFRVFKAAYYHIMVSPVYQGRVFRKNRGIFSHLALWMILDIAAKHYRTYMSADVLAVLVDNPPCRCLLFWYVPDAAAAVAPGHIRPSWIAAIDTGYQRNLRPG
jgi:hypothetical protein